MKKSILIIVTLIVLFNSSIVLAEDLSKDTQIKIDSQVMKIVKTIGYTVVLFYGLKEIIQEAMKGDTKAIGSVVVKYIIIYAALLGLPTALKWVESFMEGMR